MAVKLEQKQVKDLVNGALKQTLGEEELSNLDLTNVVDIGVALENANAYRNFLYNLGLSISKTIFVTRKYSSKAPNVLRDSFEYGQITQKVRAGLPEAMNNQSFELQDGVSYDDNVFVGFPVKTKLFMKRVTFEIRCSITNLQIKNAFTSEAELGSFVSLIYNQVENALTLYTDELIMLTIDNFIGEVSHENKASRYINVLGEFKKLHPDSQLTAETCLYDKDYLIFLQMLIKQTMKRLETYKTKYNSGDIPTFTPRDMQHLVLLDQVNDYMEAFAYSSTWHDEFVKMPYAQTVEYWQGTGIGEDVVDESKIMIKTASGNTVTLSNIIGVLFDHDALGVNYEDMTVEEKYIRSGQFTNYWYKPQFGYFNDLDENFVVFYNA